MVNETAIAIGVDRALAVYHVINPAANSVQIGFAFWALDEVGEWRWEGEGTIPDPNSVSLGKITGDPSATYDDATGDFLVAVLGSSPGTMDSRLVLTCRWDSQTGFGPWTNRGSGDVADKPWMVAGELLATEGPFDRREHYLVWNDKPAGLPAGLEYRRSCDSGSTWSGGDITVGGARVLAVGWPLPRVYSSGPLYVAYVASDEGRCHRKVRIVRGNDVLAGCGMNWTQLKDSQAAPLEITLNAGSNISLRLPGQQYLFSPGPGVGFGVDFAVDPSNAARLYLAYHDTDPAPGCDPCTEPPCDPDVNVYLQVLTRVSGAVWSVGPRLSVTPDTPTSDQFMPQITVDDDGFIHIIYYDDRDVTPDQPDGVNAARFDVYYAFNDAQGAAQSWQYGKLCETPYANPPCSGEDDDHAIDATSQLPGRADWLRDYNGIAWGSDRIWTTFMGLTDDDPTTDKTRIWSSQVLRP